MIVTVATVVFTHDLSLGVLVGVLLSAVFFARHVSKLVSIDTHVDDSSDGTSHHRYLVRGELFFVSVEQFIAAFDFQTAASDVTIDLTHAHVWDASAVAAIDRVVLKLRSTGTRVHLVGTNDASTALLTRLATHNDPTAELVAGH